MIQASCHCGAVRLEIDGPPPETLNACQCLHCLKRGGLWAYYSPKQVRVVSPPEATTNYMSGDRMLELHFCKVCGCTAYWAPVDKDYDRMGINARLMPPAVWTAIPIRESPGPPE